MNHDLASQAEQAETSRENSVRIRLSREEKVRLRKLAKRKGKTVSDVVRSELGLSAEQGATPLFERIAATIFDLENEQYNIEIEHMEAARILASQNMPFIAHLVLAAEARAKGLAFGDLIEHVKGWQEEASATSDSNSLQAQ